RSPARAGNGARPTWRASPIISTRSAATGCCGCSSPRATTGWDHGSSSHSPPRLPQGTRPCRGAHCPREPLRRALPGGTGLRTGDVSGALRWDLHRASIEVGLARRDSFAPVGHPVGLKPLGGLGPTQATRYLTVHGALELLPGLHVSGWYFDPYVSGGNDF